MDKVSWLTHQLSFLHYIVKILTFPNINRGGKWASEFPSYSLAIWRKLDLRSWDRVWPNWSFNLNYSLSNQIQTFSHSARKLVEFYIYMYIYIYMRNYILYHLNSSASSISICFSSELKFPIFYTSQAICQTLSSSNLKTLN